MLLHSNRQATLPEDLEAPTVDSMTTGQTAYIVPWGMWVDADRQCWLHPKYSIKDRPDGSVEMRIKLTRDGFHVWVPPGATWSPEKEPSYVSPADTKYIPVVKLHR
ncbi:MAG: hypothetical protein JWN38_1264 [Candidatus Saccharibacteria bacterium]|nr:hypothetical protein [Candidatus Saccharibacteria bacterium]